MKVRGRQIGAGENGVAKLLHGIILARSRACLSNDGGLAIRDKSIHVVTVGVKASEINFNDPIRGRIRNHFSYLQTLVLGRVEEIFIRNASPVATADLCKSAKRQDSDISSLWNQCLLC